MTLALDAPSGVVFPLFGPVRESEWDAGWRPEFLFPAGGGQGEEGAVFTVAHPGAGASALWVLAEYDAARRRLQYVRFVPGHYVGQIFVAVAPNGEGKSRAEVTYVWTALSADGGDAVGRFAAEFARRQPLWERAINHYLATGRPLAH